MLGAISAADTATWVSIFVKALAYSATLLAAGSVFTCFSLRSLHAPGRISLRKLAVGSAVVAALATVLRLPLRASFLMGGTWNGAFDPVILEMVVGSPLGTSAAIRLAGLALILGILHPSRSGRLLAITGAILASASFAFRGHSLDEPRLLLVTLVTLHILALAFWIGGFAPLARAAAQEPPADAGALAHEFGTKAMWVVAAIVGTGILTFATLGALKPTVFTTPYGQMFLVKLFAFAGVMSLAALHKFSSTPALMDARPKAAQRFRRSIACEAGLVALVLVVTATLTSLAAPPKVLSLMDAVCGKVVCIKEMDQVGEPLWMV